MKKRGLWSLKGEECAHCYQLPLKNFPGSCIMKETEFIHAATPAMRLWMWYPTHCFQGILCTCSKALQADAQSVWWRGQILLQAVVFMQHVLSAWSPQTLSHQNISTLKSMKLPGLSPDAPLGTWVMSPDSQNTPKYSTAAQTQKHVDFFRWREKNNLPVSLLGSSKSTQASCEENSTPVTP